MLSRWWEGAVRGWARKLMGGMIEQVQIRRRGHRLQMMVALGIGIVLVVAVATRRVMGWIAGRVVSIARLAPADWGLEGRGDRACRKGPACFPSVGRPLLVGRGVEPRRLS
jgi:hypothetical protein